ncbi:MAG: biopolymer transporter ExbD, partial [Planctomycetota bacterium]|nr:biopolymer transporter ExbD [Planctomycetota bacterium]
MAWVESNQEIPEAVCVEARRAQRRCERKFNRRSNWRPTLNLTSMIDVVFLLLVYFMVATEFKRAEVVERLDLPNRLGAGVADPFEVPDHPVVITVSSQDTDAARSTVAAG